ncbi:MAG: hypothetical protein HeimC2_06800 [Candidatus Heimdallarchaeota archaeon LC_2]|nr:MAG: hypothetical protein HeimC2_06800 [Candidatus Heimdallarchaeota archaeon LC_2]
MSSRKKKTTDSASHLIPFRVGSYTPRKIGNNWKISIPSDIATVWKLEGKDKAGKGSKKSEKDLIEENDLIIYVEEREGKLCLVITKEPLEDDPIAKFLRKTDEED